MRKIGINRGTRRVEVGRDHSRQTHTETDRNTQGATGRHIMRNQEKERQTETEETQTHTERQREREREGERDEDKRDRVKET